MLPDRLDTLFAFKSIGLAEALTATDIRVAIVIIEHYNRVNGRCDPGLPRIARLARCCERAAARSVGRLHNTGLIARTRHGGYSGRNCYEPNWMRFRELEKQWRAKLHGANVASDRTKATPTTGHSCHVDPDCGVVQTSYENRTKEPLSLGATSLAPSQASKKAERSKAVEKRTLETQQTPLPRRGTSSAQVAREKAWQRCDGAILGLCRGHQDLYEQVVLAITPDMKEQATELELARKGSGIPHLVDRLRASGVAVPYGTSSLSSGGVNGQG